MILSKLNRYVGALAVAGVGIAASSSSAAVVYSGVVNANIPATFDGLYLNMATGATGGLGSSTPGWDLNIWVSTSTWRTFPNANGANADGGVVGSGANASNLAVGTLIDATSTFVTAASTNAPVGNGVIVGVRLFRESTSTVHFGWARLNLANPATAAGTLVDFAYEDQAGVGIQAGVPTPGAAGLLAVAGLAGIRRRR